MAKIPTYAIDQNDLALLQQDFATVEQMAANTEASETNAAGLLAQTLDQMFTFGQKLRADERAMAAFFAARRIKLNKTTSENPYNGLVKLAFSDRVKPAMRSKYARTLHYAHDSKFNRPIRDWLAESGIEDCYRKASEHFGGPKSEINALAREKQIALGQKALDGLTASAPFSLSSPVAGPYVRAIVRLNEDGMTGEIASVLETNDAEWDRIFAGYSSPQAGLHAHLAGYPLLPLFRAIDLVSGLAPAVSKGDTIILRTVDGSTVVEFASTAYSFRTARMVLALPIAEFPVDSTLGISVSDARQFAQNYPLARDWAIVSNNNGRALQSAALSMSFVLGAVAGGLNVGNFSGQKSKHFTLPWSALRIIGNAKLLQSKADATSGKRPPARLEMIVDGKTLSVSNAVHQLATLHFLNLRTAGATFAEHRNLALFDIKALADTLNDYERDFDGYFVEHDTPDAALRLEHSFDQDRLMISVPLVINARMSYSLACEAL